MLICGMDKDQEHKMFGPPPKYCELQEETSLGGWGVRYISNTQFWTFLGRWGLPPGKMFIIL
jgi:hypothetical protein